MKIFPRNSVRFTAFTPSRRLYGLVSANLDANDSDERPWRISVFNEMKTQLAVPHLTLTDFPATEEEILWHLQAQPGSDIERVMIP